MLKGKKGGKVMQVVGISAGSIGAGYLTSVVPIQNDKIKAALPLVAGFFLLGKKGIIGDVGAGMVAAGAQNLAKSFGIGAIETPVQGDDEVTYLEGHPNEESEMHGPDSPIHGEMPEDELPE